jgi:hypothetical protein
MEAQVEAALRQQIAINGSILDPKGHEFRLGENANHSAVRDRLFLHDQTIERRSIRPFQRSDLFEKDAEELHG